MARPELPELCNVRDVALLLRKSPKAVRRMRERGQLPPPIRLAGMRTLLWRKADLADLFVQSEPRVRK